MPFIVERTVTETFLQRASKTPDVTGYQYKDAREWKKVTYGEFFNEVRVISFGLMSLGVGRGDKVSILSGTRYEWNLCDMAVLGAGGVTVPIYPSSTPEDMGYILEHSEARVLILEDETQLRKLLSIREKNPSALSKLAHVIIITEALGSDGDGAVTLAALREAGRREEARDPSRFENQLRAAKPEDVLSIVYTSGTTGTPKGALITHDNMVSVLEDCVAVLSGFSSPESETILSFLPTSHIFGKFESVMGYSFGWKQAFAENLDRLMPNLLEVRPTLLFSVPRTFEKAYSSIHARAASASLGKKKLFNWAVETGRRYYSAIWKKQLPSPRDFAEYALAKKLVFRQVTHAFGGKLRYVICGGAPLPRELGEFFQIAGIKILEGYGLTETCGPISVNTPEDVRYGTVGRPLPEVSVRLASDGEIEIRSRKVFAGYYKAPDLTEAVLPSSPPADVAWFKTGDIGFIDDDGFIHITDRKKDIIVTSGGKNVAPQKAESLAKAISWISQIVVIGDRRPYLVALLTLNREEVIQVASEKGILFSEYGELIHNPKIISMTQAVIDRINSNLAKFETIKKFMILPHEFSIASGELTPSLKVKRKLIESRYSSEINQLYESAQAP